MSGCVEGILIDFSEPINETLENSSICVTDSIEILRENVAGETGNYDAIPTLSDGQLILDISTKCVETSRSTDVLLESPPITDIGTETFDFDLPVTPVTISDRSSTEEDEEEVFFGPVSHIERCMGAVVSSATKQTRPLSPLNQRQIAEIYKEANAVAGRISSAAGPKRNKSMKRENLFCAKQLNMDKSAKNIVNVFNQDAVKQLLKSVSNIRTSDEDKENSVNDNHYMEVDPGIEIQTLSELDTDSAGGSKGDKQDQSSSKSSGSEGDNTDTPSKRHNRSGTYTINKTALDQLPLDKRRSLPVVKNSGPNRDHTDSVGVSKKEIEVTQDKVGSGKKSKLDVSERKRVVTVKRSASRLQQPSVKIAKRSSLPGATAAMQSSKPRSPDETSTTCEPKSRLSIPHAGGVSANNGTGMSKMKTLGAPCKTSTSSIPGTLAPGKTATTITSNIPGKSGMQMPQKSALPGLKGKGLLMTKLQLKKPSGLQRPSTTSQNGVGDSVKKAGPMKAFNPIIKPEPDVFTPAKVEKHIQRKNLSSSFSTPVKNGSCSSIDSPASSVKKRRSCLPTPTKSRFGSSSSIPSPCGSRTSSTGSSRGIESPLVTGSRTRRPSMGTNSAIKYGSLEQLDDSSPSGMRPRRQLVTNTPNMPKKKLSAWSPVQRKKPIDLVDQAILCTKKLKK